MMMFSNIHDAAKKALGGGGGRAALRRRFGALLLAVSLLAAIPMGAAAAEGPASTDEPAETNAAPISGDPDDDYAVALSTHPESSDLAEFLDNVTITGKDGEVVSPEGGTLYVGEDYHIKLEFSEKDMGGIQLKLDENGCLTYQIPKGFSVSPRTSTLVVTINGKPTEVGTYTIDENGLLTVTLNDQGKQAMRDAENFTINFDMDATAQRNDGGGDSAFNFGGTGKDFDFEVVDQARVEVDKQGKFTENEGNAGGKLEYTVTTTVKHGSVHELSVLDVLTPPNTSALEIQDVDTDAIKVTLKQLQADGTVKEVELTKDTDYELVEAPDAEYTGKKTFQVKLKEGSGYYTLNEGDALVVTYPYDVEYKKGSTDVFWGNVENDVHVTGKGTVPPPADKPDAGTPEIPIDERRGSNVEIQVVPPGDGIIFKTQEFSEKDHKLHYTLYTTVPAGTWTPFYIHDDMVVEFGGKRYNLLEFKENGRVSNLKVSAVDVEEGNLGDWSDSTDEQRQQSLEELKAKAQELTGYDMYNVWNQSPEGYDPNSVENCIRLWLNNNLDIVFGEWEYAKLSAWGNWNYQKDRLIITEYDLDMSNDKGPLTLVDTSDYVTTIEKEASEVLLAGIRNAVYMRFDGYYPGYSVFFNNADRMNKTGVPDKSDNSITWTVTMNTTDTTVNKYFQEVRDDWMAYANEIYHWGDMQSAYNDSMQAVFYDELPAGWEYVEGSLTATACDVWGNQSSYPYDSDQYSFHDLVTSDGGKQVIRAPLMFFFNSENTARPNLFNWFGSELASLTFTYKLKATDEWIREHATDKDAVTVHNHAEIRDNLRNQPHWTADADVPYLPQHLSKEAEQVGDGSNLLRFTLDVNPGGVQLKQDEYDPQSYLLVTDESENLQIQPDTIQVTDAETGVPLTKVSEVDLEALVAKNDWFQDQWGMVPVKDGQFQLVVPNGKHLTVTYNALIIEQGENVTVSNSASINGVARSESGIKNTLKVGDMSGSGSATTHELTIKKTGEGGKTLAGAQFEFYIVRPGKDFRLAETKTFTVGGKEYSCYHEDTWHFTTDADGNFKIKSAFGWHLEPGYCYILVETTAPEGYEKGGPILFYYGYEKDEAYKNYPGAQLVLPNGTLTVENEPVEVQEPHGSPSSLRVVKNGGVSGEEQALAGAKFTITHGETDVLYTGTSGEDGVVQWTKTGEATTSTDLQLDDGAYTLTETEAPAGYKKLEQAIEFHVKNGDIVTDPDPLPEGVKVDTESSKAVLQFIITDPSEYVLPESGGRGTASLYILGSLFLASAAVVLAREGRRKKARD